jgi:hypothetical protein
VVKARYCAIPCTKFTITREAFWVMDIGVMGIMVIGIGVMGKEAIGSPPNT